MRISGNDAARDELGRDCVPQRPACIIAKEFHHANRILAIQQSRADQATRSGAGADETPQASFAWHADHTTTSDGIAVDRRRRSVNTSCASGADYRHSGSVIVCGVLPEAGITYYDVPQTWPTPYRYTVVKRRTVLVEPAPAASFRWSSKANA